jgi:hypothetical protein
MNSNTKVKIAAEKVAEVVYCEILSADFTEEELNSYIHEIISLGKELEEDIPNLK